MSCIDLERCAELLTKRCNCRTIWTVNDLDRENINNFRCQCENCFLTINRLIYQYNNLAHVDVLEQRLECVSQWDYYSIENVNDGRPNINGDGTAKRLDFIESKLDMVLSYLRKEGHDL